MRYPMILAAAGLAACASAPEEIPPDVLAIQDYVAVAELTEVDKLRTDSTAHMQSLGNDRYILWVARRDTYLVEFGRDCWELRDRNVVADVRRDQNYLRARRDTIRGCRIGRAFEVDEGQIEEIKSLGDAPTGG